MLQTFIALLAAHMVADFILQTNWIIQHKKNPAVLMLHILIVTGLSALFVGNPDWRYLALVGATHLMMDAAKTYLMKDNLVSFVIDQSVHLIVLVAVVLVWPTLYADGCLAQIPHLGAVWPVAAAFLTGLIAIAPVGAILGRLVLARFTLELSAASLPYRLWRASQLSETPPALPGENAEEIEAHKGLREGGIWIGVLERLIVFMLILVGAPVGVGFLIAAKSILRFRDVGTDFKRSLSEVIIIGTFTSFGWAIFVSILTRLALIKLGLQLESVSL